LKQVRFKKKPPWFAFEPRLVSSVNQAWLELQPRHYFSQASVVQGGPSMKNFMEYKGFETMFFIAFFIINTFKMI
jgi:hypothetical protein